jgi:UDP-3-O-[3-hydroxymyristoyl] glucosamine N-acyltransferase
MERRAQELATLIGGTLEGNGDLLLSGLSPATAPLSGTVVPLLRRRYLPATPIAAPFAVLTVTELLADVRTLSPAAILLSNAPLPALATLIDEFYPEPARTVGIHLKAVVSFEARIGRNVLIGPNAVVEDGAEIGDGCCIGPGAVICSSARLGKFVRVGPNAVIGHDGFGFIPVDGGVKKMRQVGGVVIGDFVELGAGTCVDRGTLGDTIIEEGSRLDNLVQVGHNAHIGKNVIIAAQSGLAGSTRVEDGALIGGQVGIADHRCIGAGAMVGAKSGVTRDVKPGEQVSGYPAMGRWEWLRVMAKLKK